MHVNIEQSSQPADCCRRQWILSCCFEFFDNPTTSPSSNQVADFGSRFMEGSEARLVQYSSACSLQAGQLLCCLHAWLASWKRMPAAYCFYGLLVRVPLGQQTDCPTTACLQGNAFGARRSNDASYALGFSLPARCHPLLHWRALRRA